MIRGLIYVLLGIQVLGGAMSCQAETQAGRSAMNFVMALLALIALIGFART